MTDDIQDKVDIALSAYLDGALDESETREIKARLEVEPALAGRLMALRKANDAFRKNAAGIAEIPMSEELSSLLHRLECGGEGPLGRNGGASSNVVIFPFWRQAARAIESHRAMAASVALLTVFTIAQTVLSDRTPEGWSGDGLITASNDVGEALDTQLSGDAIVLDGGVRFTSRLSYRSDSGAYCRAFDLLYPGRKTQNVACKDDEGWRIAFSVAEPIGATSATGDYETASSTITEPLDRYLDAAIAGAPLSREGEATAVEQGWTQ